MNLIDIRHCQHLSQIADTIQQKITFPFHLIGFSLGGMAAFEVIRKISKQVQSLTLISTQYSSLNIDVRNKLEQCYTLCLRDATIYQRYIEGNSKAYFKNQKIPHQQAYIDMMERVGMSIGLQQMKLILTMPEQPFPDVTCPTLIIHGKEDYRCNLENQEYLCEQIPHVKLIEIENAAHFVLWEQADAVNREILSHLTLQGSEDRVKL